MSPDEALAALNRRGFRQVMATADALVLAFAWEAPYTDVLQIHGEDEAIAVRSSDDDAGPDLFAYGVVWKAEGCLVEVVADLLALPAPGERGAPLRVVAAPSRLWTPADGSPTPPLPGSVPFL